MFVHMPTCGGSATISGINGSRWRRCSVAWVADVPGTSGKYLAVFNAQDASADPAGTPVEVKLRDLGFSKAHVRDLWGKKDLGEFSGSFAPVIPCHGAALYRID